MASDGAYAGISVYDFTQAGSTLTIKKNNVTIAQDGFGGIWVNVFNPSTAATLDINDNTVNGADDVLDNTDGLGDPYPVFGIYLTTLNSNVSAT